MSEQTGRDAAAFRPRVWWSPTQGVIEQVEPRWPDEPMRCVRTRDRYVVPVPDDAVELHAAPEPDSTAPEGRDIYVHITQGLVVSTKEVADGVCVDLDAGGVPVGVEILGAIGVDADGKPVAHAPEPTGDAVETVARVLYDTANRDIGEPDPWEECGYRDVYRGMARAAIAAMPQQGDVEQYRHLLGCIWLYVDWKYVTRQLTTVQKELWADAVDVFGDPADRGPKAPRWWRDDYVVCEEPVCDGELECGDYADPITKRCKAHTVEDGEQQP